MDIDEIQEQARKKLLTSETKEYNKILITQDNNDRHNLSSHLHNAAQYKKSKQLHHHRKLNRKQGDLVIYDPWTSWPLPSALVPRPDPISSSLSNTSGQGYCSGAVHAEIEATILRIVRRRIHSENGICSGNEHAPYQVTREIQNQVIKKLNRLLHALSRVKYQHYSERGTFRVEKSRWDEIVGMAGISGSVDNMETMNRINNRCKSLFQEEMIVEND